MVVEENIQKVCDHNKYGFCKFGDRCRQKHIDIKCENQTCEIKTCIKRHPKECRYYRSYGRCKFGTYCLYEHIDEKNNLREEVDSIKVTLRLLESKMDENNESKEKEIHDNETEDFKKQVVTFKAELKTVKTMIETREATINSLIKDMKEHFQSELEAVRKESVSAEVTYGRATNSELMTSDYHSQKPSRGASPCCQYRCCSGTYSSARRCPGPGHQRSKGDETICCNHKLKM